VREQGDAWRESPVLQEIDTLRQDASAVLDRVRDHERAREGRPFAGRTDITGSSNVCRRDWLGQASEQEGSIQYALKQVQPRRGRGYLCGRLGVRAPRISGEEETVYLRVWGGGAERLRLEAGEEGLDRRSDVISLPPTSSRFYYFAQLENESGRPLSLPLALDPNVVPTEPAAASAPRCPDARRLIALEAERSAEHEAAPADEGGRRGRSPRTSPSARDVEVEAESTTRTR
jgi:hypothetical protein